MRRGKWVKKVSIRCFVEKTGIVRPPSDFTALFMPFIQNAPKQDISKRRQMVQSIIP